MLKRLALVVPRSEASETLPELLKMNAVDQSLRIRSSGDSVLIPLKYGAEISTEHVKRVEDFEKRAFHSSPLSVILKRLSEIGIDSKYAPDRWVRLGSSIIARFPDAEYETKEKVASVCAEILNVKSVYEITGRIIGQFRKPENRLIFGPGGDVTHLENGIRFTMDPEKVMFSPGNVNIRTAVREMELKGKTVLDMFSGIGYFSLGIAKYSGMHEIHSCEINPVSFEYLRRNIKINKLEGKVIPHLGDSRIVAPDISVDVIVMGNFLSFTYLPHALVRLRPGGTIIMHDLVSSEKLERYRYDLYHRLRSYGWRGSVVEQKIVKSFAPHMWHIYVNVTVSDNRP